jgi:hypothetical protein
MKRKVNSRAKGAAGEREFCNELADILGETLVAPLKRNLEQTRVGGHDIVGLDGWAIEVKRYKNLTEGEIKEFWQQAVDQAKRVDCTPVLAYREDFRSWRVRIPMGFLGDGQWIDDVDFTVEMSLVAFATVVREHLHEALHNNEAPHNIQL